MRRGGKKGAAERGPPFFLEEFLLGLHLGLAASSANLLLFEQRAKLFTGTGTRPAAS